MSRPIIFDAHIHFYPEYDAALALHLAKENFIQAGRGLQRGDNPIYALCLTERADCHFFRSLRESKSFPGMAEVKILEVGGALKLILPESDEIFIIPGRQIISSERIEILAFGSDIEIPDRKFQSDRLFELIKKAGGLPVINWAPGKWWFKRGNIVSQMISSASAGELLLCDTTLRPLGYCEPCLMRKANSKGVKILRGSDPLPIRGEEAMLGRYLTRADADFDEASPVDSLKRILTDPTIKLEAGGRRSNIFEWLTRMVKFYSAQ